MARWKTRSAPSDGASDRIGARRQQRREARFLGRTHPRGHEHGIDRPPAEADRRTDADRRASLEQRAALSGFELPLAFGFVAAAADGEARLAALGAVGGRRIGGPRLLGVAA